MIDSAIAVLLSPPRYSSRQVALLLVSKASLFFFFSFFPLLLKSILNISIKSDFKYQPEKKITFFFSELKVFLKKLSSDFSSLVKLNGLHSHTLNSSTVV